MYVYDTKAIEKLQQAGAVFTVFSNGKSIVVKSTTFIPNAGAVQIKAGGNK